MSQIGRYEILSELGRGGFGRVYRAHDPLMNRQVAVKVMNASDDPDLLARFRNEAVSSGNLHHENIVTVYDFGDQQGVPYIVMEYLEGMDLQQMHDRKVPMTLLQRLRILSQTACGLQAAHEHGIIHRDVKPANIMVLKDGTVKVMDFGIARLNRADVTRHTRTGLLVGTLHYISPEQFEGQPADQFADLWSFGVIAYQLLADRHPFEGGDTAQIIYRITSFHIPELQQVSPSLPEDLCAMVNRMLKRERSARYQSFEDVRIELNPILERLDAQEAARLVDEARVLAARGDLTNAHQIVRNILERHPSNTSARQLRDHIVTQIRSTQAKSQIDALLSKGDQDVASGRYEEAAAAYEQACKLNPASGTARMKLDRAKALAESARKGREELNRARGKLGSGLVRDAERILLTLLAENPENQEARGLLVEIQRELAKQEEAQLADAILRSRMLCTEQRYHEALQILDSCMNQVGEHPQLLESIEEIRREAREFADAKSAAAASSPSSSDAWRDRSAIVAKALALSRRHESEGKTAEAIHVLELALSRYPEASDLAAEKRRLQRPPVRSAPPERLPPADPNSQATQLFPIPQPPAPPVQVPPATPPSSPAAARRRVGMVGGVVAAAAIGGVLLWHPWKQPASAPAPAPVSIAPAPKLPEPVKQAEPEPPVVAAPAPKAEPEKLPALSVPALLRFSWVRGTPAPDAQVVAVNRAEFQASVAAGKGWLRATRRGSTVAVSVYPAGASLGENRGQIRIAAGEEAASMAVVLNVTAPVERPVPVPQPPVQTAPPPVQQAPVQSAPASAQSAPAAAPGPWLGAKRGNISWTGNLAPGAKLVLGVNGVIAGEGQLSGRLPTADIAISNLVPGTLKTDVLPAASVQRVVITNTSGAPVNLIRFTWNVQ